MANLRVVESKNVSLYKMKHIWFSPTEAYDTIPFTELFKVLEDSPISVRRMKGITVLYKNARSTVKIENTLTREFFITKSLRQGCHIFFSIFPDAAVKQSRRKCRGMESVEEAIFYTLN